MKRKIKGGQERSPFPKIKNFKDFIKKSNEDSFVNIPNFLWTKFIKTGFSKFKERWAKFIKPRSIKFIKLFERKRPKKPNVEDWLDRREFAYKIADTLLEKIRDVEKTNVSEGFVFGISGRWGEGKTTILDMIEEKLNQEDLAIKIFRFNAWQYSDDPSSLRRKFIEGLSKELKKKPKDIDKLRYNQSMIGIDWVKFSIFIIIFGFIIWLFEYQEYKFFLPIGAIIALLSWMLFSLRIKKSFQKISTCDEFEKIFENLLEKYKKPFVVFIDDLDRCTPEGVYRVIDAIKTFFKNKRCNFVITGDHSVIEHYVGSKLHIKPAFKEDGTKNEKGTLLKEKIEGQRYLKKIFNINWNIPLPEPNVFREYIIEKIDEIVPSVNKNDNIVNLIESFMRKNPRNVERFLTDLEFRLLSVTEQKEKLEDENKSENENKISNLKIILKYPNFLSKMLLIKDLFYDEYIKIENSPENYKNLEKSVLENKDLPEDAKGGFEDLEDHRKEDYIKLLLTPPYVWLVKNDKTKYSILDIENFIYPTGLSSKPDIGIDIPSFIELVVTNNPAVESELRLKSQEKRDEIIRGGIENFTTIPDEQKKAFIKNIFELVFKKIKESRSQLKAFLNNQQIKEFCKDNFFSDESRNELISPLTDILRSDKDTLNILKILKVDPIWSQIWPEVEQKVIHEKTQEIQNFENIAVAPLKNIKNYLNSIPQEINIVNIVKTNDLFGNLAKKLRDLCERIEEKKAKILLSILVKNYRAWNDVPSVERNILLLFSKNKRISKKYPNEAREVWNSWH